MGGSQHCTGSGWAGWPWGRGRHAWFCSRDCHRCTQAFLCGGGLAPVRKLGLLSKWRVPESIETNSSGIHVFGGQGMRKWGQSWRQGATVQFLIYMECDITFRTQKRTQWVCFQGSPWPCTAWAWRPPPAKGLTETGTEAVSQVSIPTTHPSGLAEVQGPGPRLGQCFGKVSFPGMFALIGASIY